MPNKRRLISPDGYAVNVVRHPSIRAFGLFRGGLEGLLHRAVHGGIRFLGVLHPETRTAYIALGKTFHGNLANQLVMKGIPPKLREAWERRQYEVNDWRVFSGKYELGSFEAEQDFGMGPKEWGILQTAIGKIHGRKAAEMLCEREE